jgi:hypothetical protein
MATEMSPMLHRIQPAASGANGDETCLSRQCPAPQTGISNVSTPGRAKLPLSRKPSRPLSIFPRPLPRASPPPNLTRSSSPSGTTRRNSCDGAPQLDQGAALRFVGYQEFGCTAFQLRMVFTQGATESKSGVCMTSTPTSILLPSP